MWGEGGHVSARGAAGKGGCVERERGEARGLGVGGHLEGGGGTGELIIPHHHHHSSHVLNTFHSIIFRLLLQIATCS